MDFRVKRTYVEPTAGEATVRGDRVAHKVTAESAQLAALDFVSRDNARLLGVLSELPTGEVTGTAWRDGRVYVFFVDPWDGEMPSVS